MVTTRRLPFVLSQITLATALVMTQFSGTALASDDDPTRSWWKYYSSSATLLDETDV
jgi:hypothetical protein